MPHPAAVRYRDNRILKALPKLDEEEGCFDAGNDLFWLTPGAKQPTLEVDNCAVHGHPDKKGPVFTRYRSAVRALE